MKSKRIAGLSPLPDRWPRTGFHSGAYQTIPVRMADPPLVTELVILDFSSFQRGDYYCPLHLHHFHQFDAILNGQVTIYAEGAKPIQAKAGDGFLIPSLLRHASESKRAFSQGSFKFHIAPRYGPFFGSGLRRVRLSTALMSAIRASALRFKNKSPLAGQHAVAVLTQCLIESLGRTPAHAFMSESLDQFRRRLWPLLERISAEPYAERSVQRLAAECHMSLNHFSLCFRKIFRQTPQRHLFEARMRAAAADLVANPQPSIKEVTERAGYSTVHSFSRAFKEAFGVNPGAYQHGETRG